MDSKTLQILIAMVAYMIVVIGIGLFYAKRANKNSENYFLGGRSLGPWVTAMSAEASDMSGWLLMGLPGVAYWCGLADATWTAIGLAVGTYLNWLIVSKRLRRYSIRANNSITLPEFFSNRFREKKPIIMILAALFILIFFTAYAASCFVTCGKLFSTLFGTSFNTMVLVGAAFVLLYTILGGFLAESASDFMQAIVMVVALVVVVGVGIFKAGGISEIVNNAREIPGFFEFFGLASPTVDEAGKQLIDAAGKPMFSDPAPYGALSVASMMAWGLGYFGMPQVLLRFMAIRKESELKLSRRVAIVWVVISLGVAVFIGIMGRYLYPTALDTKSAAENIFIILSRCFFPPILAGFIMAGILAATISSSDSYLLIAASSLAKNIYHGVVNKKASEKKILVITRVTLIVLTIIGVLFSLDWKEINPNININNSVIFEIVSFAWAGFGATFGPLMLFSLFWKRTTRWGAVAGMVGGAGMVFLWNMVISELGGAFAIYELLPAFIFSSICIVVVSLLTPKPSKEIEEDFEAVKLGNVE
ncbi:MAG: sodium/proline symporter [Clostridia bacterium]|nr:sodium/proline symporter [Clostridia bacterium]